MRFVARICHWEVRSTVVNASIAEEGCVGREPMLGLLYSRGWFWTLDNACREHEDLRTKSERDVFGEEKFCPGLSSLAAPLCRHFRHVRDMLQPEQLDWRCQSYDLSTKAAIRVLRSSNFYPRFWKMQKDTPSFLNSFEVPNLFRQLEGIFPGVHSHWCTVALNSLCPGVPSCSRLYSLDNARICR